jgi:hypothetical protein
MSHGYFLSLHFFFLFICPFSSLAFAPEKYLVPHFASKLLYDLAMAAHWGFRAPAVAREYPFPSDTGANGTGNSPVLTLPRY